MQPVKPKQLLRRAANAIASSTVVRYSVVLLGGLVLICLVGDNSLYSHYRNQRRIAVLQAEINALRKQNHDAQAKLHMLDRDPKSIEKIARERYFMKADDEDIFVVKEE